MPARRSWQAKMRRTTPRKAAFLLEKRRASCTGIPGERLEKQRAAVVCEADQKLVVVFRMTQPGVRQGGFQLQILIKRIQIDLKGGFLLISDISFRDKKTDQGESDQDQGCHADAQSGKAKTKCSDHKQNNSFDKEADITARLPDGSRCPGRFSVPDGCPQISAGAAESGYSYPGFRFPPPRPGPRLSSG